MLSGMRGGERRLSRQHVLMLSRLSRGAGASIALLGLVVLVGWARDLTLLKTLLPGLVAMKANTAVAFVLLSTSIVLRTAPGRSARLRVAGLAATLLAGLIGAASLAEYLTGWDAGIDQLLFRDLQPDPRAPVPGRMAAATAVAFTVLAAGIVLLDAAGRGRRIGEGLVLVAGWIGGFAVVGYLLGADALYSSIAFSAMALHTSLAFVLAAAAALCAQPAIGLARVLVLDSAGGRSARQLMPVALLAPVAVGLVVHLGRERGLYLPDLELPIASVVSALSLSFLIWVGATHLDRSETMRRRAESEALTDPLTGLANRRWLDIAIGEEQRVAGRTHPYSVVLADVDGLKKINDRGGHAAGDEALRAVASVLRLVTRPTDVAARIGGDEFVILLPETDGAGAARVVARVASLVGHIGSDDRMRPVNLTMGTATWAPGDDAPAILGRADLALYRGKRGGSPSEAGSR